MMRRFQLGACAALLELAALVALTVLASGCPDSKEPMHADNPNADPLMMDAGGPLPSSDMDAAPLEQPTPAPSSP